MAATTALVGGALAAGAYTANKSAKASKNAAEAQSEASQAGIDEQRRQFDIAVKTLSPYVQAGNKAVWTQQALLGLQGADVQKQALANIQYSPTFKAIAQQGENAILQNASATGGLRGGNTQGALAQFRPQLLNQLVQQQFQNLGGLTQVGQASAAGQASAGLQTGSNIANLLGQQGSAQAGGILGAQNAQNQMIGNLIGLGGAAIGSGAF